MYTLRTIDPDRSTYQQCLNSRYVYHDRFGAHSGQKAFRDKFYQLYGKHHTADGDWDCKAIAGICEDENGKLFPVHIYQEAYIMTDSGKTFERLHLPDDRLVENWLQQQPVQSPEETDPPTPDVINVDGEISIQNFKTKFDGIRSDGVILKSNYVISTKRHADQLIEGLRVLRECFEE